MELESGEKSFSCVQCNKLFRFKSRLETHMRVHTGEKPFICPACNHHFTQFGSLKKHMKLCHTGHTVDDILIFNGQPDLKFTKDESLSSSVMNNQEEFDEKPYSCDRCNKLFKYKSRWETHMRSHTGEKPFGCSMCSKQFTQVGSLRRHMKYHIGDESIVCEQSDCESSKDESLMCLVNNIFSEKPVVCDQFMKNDDCEEHDETCADEMQFKIYNRSEDQFKQIIDPRLNISRTGEMQLLRNSPLQPGNVTEDTNWNSNEKMFSCDRCDKQFRYKSRLEMHLRIHTGEKPMSCSMCNKQYTQVGSLRRHMKCHMCDEPVVSDYTIIKDESSNRSHVDMRRGKPAICDQRIKNTEPSDCNESDKQFKRAINLEVQMISRAISPSRENLSACSSLFTNDNTEQDMELKSEESLLNCELCNKQFEFKSRLETHMRVHTGEKPFNCNVCSRQFTQGGSLKKHMRCHAREPQFICDQSNSASLADGFLKIPLTPVRDVLGEIELICNEFIKSTNKKLQKPWTDQMSFVCNRCNAEFKQMVDLERHAISHAGERRQSVDDPILQNDFSKSNIESDLVEELFSCKECDKQFEYKSRWETHMRIHTGEKPFNCSMCNKQFTQVGSLRRHVKCHTNDSFICEQSDSKSTKDGYLASPVDNILVEKPVIYNRFSIKSTDSKELVKSGRGEMTSVCSPCNSMFEQPVDFDNHVIPQTGVNGNLRNNELKSDLESESAVNLFSCDQCDKIFEYKSRFETHMRIHTGERPYECSRCSQQFTQAGSLRRHMKSMKCHIREEFVVSEQSGVDSRNDEYLNGLVENTDNEKSDFRDQIMTNTNSCMNPCRGEMLIGCNVCNEQFSQTVDLERHNIVHTSEKQQLVCDRPLQNNFMNLESGEKLFSCNKCNKSFRYKFRLIMHTKTHTEEKPFKCSVCNEKFKQAGNFREHMKCHVSGGVNSFYISNWPVYKSATISNNKRWKQIVDSKRRATSRAQHKRFVCDWCNKRFTRNSILKKHRTVHTGET